MAVKIHYDAEPIPGYRLIERIGVGGFGEVWKAKAPGGLLKAIKFVHGDMESAEDEGMRAEQELKALKRVQNVRHSYMLSLERYDIVDGQLIIVMELADRTLWDRFKECRSNGLPGIPRPELIGYMKEAAEALDFMYEEFQLLHLDIKPQNIFLVHNHAKVADFGLIKGLEGTAASITGGVTPVYAAPETFDGHCMSSTDQYSLAIVYQELLTGQRPFTGTTARQLVLQHLQAEPDLSFLPANDQPAVRRALEKDHSQRFKTCLEFVRALENKDVSNSTVAEPPERSGPSLPIPSGPTNGFSTDSEAEDSAWNRSTSPQNRQNNYRKDSSKRKEGVELPGGVVSETTDVESPQPAEPVRTHSNHSPMSFSTPRDGEPDSDKAFYDGNEPESHSSALEAAHGKLASEICEDGILRPALVIGVGSLGRAAVCRFRDQVTDCFGSIDDIPNIRTLILDADPEAIRLATCGEESAVKQGETLLTRLRRPSHYIKQKNDRKDVKSAVEDWLPQKLIYRIPRHLTPSGVRAFGRLAFVDNYELIYQRIKTELKACFDVNNLNRAHEKTGAGIVSTAPRICLVTSLAGGTGSGMFIDLAYLLRNLLHKYGDDAPDVVGVLMLPRESKRDPVNAESANVVAALTELQYFSRADTVYVDKIGGNRLSDQGAHRCSDPPFRRCVLVPPKGKSDSKWDEKSATSLPPTNAMAAADLLFVDLCTHLGRDVDKLRREWSEPDNPAGSKQTGSLIYQSADMIRIYWPQKLVVHHAANKLCRRLVAHWMSKDAKHLSSSVAKWVQENWANMELGADRLIPRFQEACSVRMGKDPESTFDELVSPIDLALHEPPKRGKQASQVESVLPLGKVVGAIEKFEELLGVPEGCQSGGPTTGPGIPGKITEALKEELSALGNEFEVKIAELVVRLIEQPEFRLAGAEETLRQFILIVDKALENQEELNREVQKRAAAMYVRMHALLEAPEEALEKTSTWRLKFTRRTNSRTNQYTKELIDLLRSYPKTRYQSVILQQINALYVSLRGQLSDQLREVDFCRDRLSQMAEKLKEEDERQRKRSRIPGQDRSSLEILLPAGCRTIDRASELLSERITDQEFQQLDHLVEKMIRKKFRALVHICMSSSSLLRNVIPRMLGVAQTFLSDYTESADAAQMYLNKFLRSPSGDETPEKALAKELQSTFQSVRPLSLDSSQDYSICSLACPSSAEGEKLLQAIQEALPEHNVQFSNSAEEIVIYREQLSPSLDELGQLNGNSRQTYQRLSSHGHLTPHNRFDITAWTSAS